MWKQLVFAAALISLLVLPIAASAQNSPFRVWQTFSGEDTAAIRAAVSDFAPQSGAMELVYVDGPFLLDAIQQALSAGNPPDVIFASNSNATPLIQSDLLSTAAGSSPFFLEDLLAAFPDLAVEMCGKEALESCLWTDARLTFPLVIPQARTVSLATSGLCKASPWLPFCSKTALAMAPLGWDFILYLINTEWLAANGIERPVTVDDVLDLRSEYAIRFMTAQPDAIPMVDEAKYPPVYVLPSTLLRDDPGAVMDSLATFYQADYMPVIGLNIYGAYITADAEHPDAANDLARALANDADTKLALMDDAGRVPALNAGELAALDPDDPIVLYTLQTLALLTTYAAAY